MFFVFLTFLCLILTFLRLWTQEPIKKLVRDSADARHAANSVPSSRRSGVYNVIFVCSTLRLRLRNDIFKKYSKSKAFGSIMPAAWRKWQPKTTRWISRNGMFVAGTDLQVYSALASSYNDPFIIFSIYIIQARPDLGVAYSDCYSQKGFHEFMGPHSEEKFYVFWTCFCITVHRYSI